MCIRDRDQPRAQILAFADARRGQSGIVYGATRARAESLAAALNEAGLPAMAYHGGMEAEARRDYFVALALLERAQRIDPESGEIYLQLARTHRARGDVDQARATAERGMLFCSGSAQCSALRALSR